MPKINHTAAVGVRPCGDMTLADWEAEYWWREQIQAEKLEDMGAMRAAVAVGVSVLVLWVPLLVAFACWLEWRS